MHDVRERQIAHGSGPAENEIRQRAYEIYLARKGLPGSEIEDWLQAEAELRQGHADSQATQGPFKRVLCAVDFDENCRAAIETACSFLATQGTLFVFHAMGFPLALTREESVAPLSNAKEKIEMMVRGQVRNGVTCQVIVESDDNAIKSILEAARRISAECIVIATHGRKTLDRFLLGSVAEKLLAGLPARW